MTMSRPTLEPSVLRACTVVSAWKSLLLCVAIYLTVIGLAWLGGRGSHWYLALPVMLVVAGLQNHLLILLQ